MRTGELHTAARVVTRDELEALVWAVSRTRDARAVDRLMKAVDLYVAWRIGSAAEPWMPTKSEASEGLSTAERDVTWRETQNQVRRDKRAAEMRTRLEEAAGRVPEPKPAAVAVDMSKMEKIVCTKCKQTKLRGPGGDFHTDSSRKMGYHARCKDCRNEVMRKRREDETAAAPPVAGMRECSKCGEEKNAETEFYQRKSGLRGRCKACEKTERANRRAVAIAAEALGI